MTPAQHKGQVLVVDDDAVNRLVLSRMLQMRGYQVIEAADGIEAVAQATASAPELVLMDINMPRMTGIDAARRIVTAFPTAPPRIVAVTANTSSAQRAECEAAGFRGFIGKPVKIKSLFAVLDDGS
jgi:CheY-like chemotaxis protein